MFVDDFSLRVVMPDEFDSYAKNSEYILPENKCKKKS